MRVTTKAFMYAARFVASQKLKVSRPHIEGILFEPQKRGCIRLIATNGLTLIIVHDGTINTEEESFKIYINPQVNGLLAACKKGDEVEIAETGIIRVFGRSGLIYVSPVNCINEYESPKYEEIFPTELEANSSNYQLDASLLQQFDLGQGIVIYPVGGNMDPLIVQPDLTGLRHEINDALGILMPQRNNRHATETLSESYIKGFLNQE